MFLLPRYKVAENPLVLDHWQIVDQIQTAKEMFKIHLNWNRLCFVLIRLEPRQKLRLTLRRNGRGYFEEISFQKTGQNIGRTSRQLAEGQDLCRDGICELGDGEDL